MTCPACQRDLPADPDALYCPYCGYYLPTDVSLSDEPPTGEAIGRYQLVRPIARGGMGEVLLVHDPATRRQVALKRILPKLREKEILHKRFLREAWVGSQLAHPGVIPVYEICADGEELYYTMPYVEGNTLKSLLRRAKENSSDPDSQIPALARVFMSVCQTVAYAHSRGILHRDLKPDNIMVGSYGQVLVVDWGLAKWERDLPEGDLPEVEAELTQPGKVFGTLAYLAPEVALGRPTSTASDIYALGAMLYQILALRPPFSRKNLSEFRKGVNQEQWVSPSRAAPFRNVPKMLARIARRCLRRRSEERYPNVDELIHDLQNYLEGRSDWFPFAELEMDKREHWGLHENLHLSSHLALTQTLEGSEWYSVMVSKDSFPGNVALSGRICLQKGGSGVGLLLAVPDLLEGAQSGICLWLGSADNPGAKLFRHQLEVVSHPDIALADGQWYSVRIEKVANSINVFLDDMRIFTYTSYLPLPGKRVGLLYRDTHFLLEGMQVLVGNYSIRVNCLAVPDAFLAEHLYDKAIIEYRRIAASFPERDEGREALFRAGVAQLERAKASGKEKLFDRALREFSHLHDTPAAPLELLGKALVYQALDDCEEEAKCFELALRRYPDHPRLSSVQEHLVYRLQQSSKRDRASTYRLALLAALFEPIWQSSRVQTVVASLERHWEPLPFLQAQDGRQRLAIHLCFWLARPLSLQELLPDLKGPLLCDALFALAELGVDVDLSPYKNDPLVARYQMDQAIRYEDPDRVLAISLDSPYAIWAHLQKGDLAAAKVLLDNHSLEEIQRETNILHFLYGCYLAATEGEELARIHFAGVLETPYPRSWTLFGHDLTDRIVQKRAWEQRAFLWERRQLHRQQLLYFTLLGDEAAATHARAQEALCYV